MPPSVGIDLGGTKILAALVVDGAVAQVAKRDTPRAGGPGAVLDAVVEAAGELRHPELAAVGIGAPGPVDPRSRAVGPAPNLPGWDRPVAVAERLEAELGVPVAVENDVNAAVVGEHRLGAAAGHGDVLGVWVGTGVGGGLLLDGRLRRGRGLAGEIGHTVVVAGGRRCGCGGRGHLEAYAGRASMELEARRAHDAGRATLLVELAGKKRIKSSVFAKALAAGDEVARELVGEAVDALAIALAAATLLVDLELVVMGGGLAHRLGPGFLGEVEQATARLVMAGWALPVVPAQLGDHAGPLGAAMLALDRYPRQDDPARAT